MGHASARHLALDEHGRFTHDGGIVEPRTFEHPNVCLIRHEEPYAWNGG